MADTLPPYRYTPELAAEIELRWQDRWEADGTYEAPNPAGPLADPEAVAAILSKYVVLTRMQPGCRNVDLCASVTRPGRYLVIQKWDSIDAQRAHVDSEVMVDMARACTGLLTGPPDIDLWDGPSAHDLR